MHRRHLMRVGLAACATIAMPAVLRGQGPQAVSIGAIHPVAGFFGYAGRQSRAGVELAVDEINAGGGIRSLDGAPLEAIFVDSAVDPEGTFEQVDSLANRGVSGIVGAYSSRLTLGVTQAASRHGLPVAVDVAISDRVVRRGLPNVFRLGPGYTLLADALANQIMALSRRPADPVTRAMIVHVDAPYGFGVMRRMRELLETAGIEIVSIQAQTPGFEDYSRFVNSVESQRPDILIPALFYADFANMKRALDSVAMRPRLVASLHGGPTSSPLFLKEFPGFSESVVDATHWYDPSNQAHASRLAKAAERGIDYGHEVFMAANATFLLADAIDRAGSRERDAVQASLLTSNFNTHGMPYGATRFVDGQNQGAQAALVQVQDGSIRLVAPPRFANAELRVGPPLPPAEIPANSDDQQTGDEASAEEAAIETPTLDERLTEPLPVMDDQASQQDTQ